MRVAIANRGEVAVRIIRACQELGHVSVLLASDPDKNSLAARLADEVVSLGGFEASQNYLDIQKVVSAAKNAHCQMLHPGFGFLSETAEFVDAVEQAGMIFVGPSADVMRQTGNKIAAKNLAEKAGVPTTPSYRGNEQEPAKLQIEAQKLGFPVIIKAARGGGGKGMKVCLGQNEFNELCESAQREAKAAFGSSQVFIEKYLEKPRHIEIQILGDKAGNVVHLFERDCSVQRRHQKIIEETPSPSLSPELRKKIGEAAVKIAKAAGYYNAGTVEFLVDKNDQFYFMELNTRLQVEHPVTELVCGLDLVKLQFKVASGQNLPFNQSDIAPRGHAIELRLYAEDPANQFLPSTGKIWALELPTGPGRRFDFGFEAGDTLTSYYDPMVGKLISWSETRPQNLQRMLSILNDTIVFGIKTNIEFLKTVLESKDFQSGNFDTGFIAKNYPNGFTAKELTPIQKQFAESAISHSSSASESETSPEAGRATASPWVQGGAWRLS